jgi:hypothetical protein
VSRADSPSRPSGFRSTSWRVRATVGDALWSRADGRIAACSRPRSAPIHLTCATTPADLPRCDTTGASALCDNIGASALRDTRGIDVRLTMLAATRGRLAGALSPVTAVGDCAFGVGNERRISSASSPRHRSKQCRPSRRQRRRVCCSPLPTGAVARMLSSPMATRCTTPGATAFAAIEGRLPGLAAPD